MVSPLFLYAIDDMSEEEKKIKKRFDEFENTINAFVELYRDIGEELEFTPNAAKSLNDWYWIRKETDIVPYMEAENVDKGLKINSYKIISGLELAVIGFQPILHNDENRRSELNAHLAWTLGLSFLIDWHDLDGDTITNIIENESKVGGFVKEHLAWLAKLEVLYIYPIFSNSHTWWNFHTALELYSEKYKTL
jgi:hypothetical protein